MKTKKILGMVNAANADRDIAKITAKYIKNGTFLSLETHPERNGKVSYEILIKA